MLSWSGRTLPLAEVTMPFTSFGKTGDIELSTAEDLIKTKTVKKLTRIPAKRSETPTATS
jgi:hypothetical protein